MLFIRNIKAKLNTQSDSVRVKLAFYITIEYFNTHFNSLHIFTLLLLLLLLLGKEKGKGKYSCRVSCTFGLTNCTLPARWQSRFIIAVWSFLNFLVLVESPFTWFSLQLWKRTFFPFQGWYILCVLSNAFMDTGSQTPLLTQWLESDEKKRAIHSHPAWFVAFNQAHTCINYDCGHRCLHPWWTVTLPLRWPPRSTLDKRYNQRQSLRQRSKLTFSKSRRLATFYFKMVFIQNIQSPKKKRKREGEDTSERHVFIT